MQLNMITQTLLNQLKTRNPQGYQLINQAMQNNGNPQAMLKQLMGNAKPEEKKALFERAKQYGCPDSVLYQIQNMK